MAPSSDCWVYCNAKADRDKRQSNLIQIGAVTTPLQLIARTPMLEHPSYSFTAIFYDKRAGFLALRRVLTQYISLLHIRYLGQSVHIKRQKAQTKSQFKTVIMRSFTHNAENAAYVASIRPIELSRQGP